MGVLQPAHVHADPGSIDLIRLDWMTIASSLSAPLRDIPVHNEITSGWDDSGVVIHHSNLFFEDGFSDGLHAKFSHLMAYTPFRDPGDENPHLVFSNNGSNWTETLCLVGGSCEESIPNPVWSPNKMEALPGWETNSIIHLSDPDILVDDFGAIWLAFRVKLNHDSLTAKYQIVMTKSTDMGLHWTTPQVIIDTSAGDPVKGGLWSPAIWQDTAGICHMLGVYTNAYGVNELDSVNTIAHWTCLGPDLDGEWVEDSVLRGFLPPDTTTQDWWHPEVVVRDDGSLLMVMATTSARGSGDNSRLFLAKSSDNGYTWDALGHVVDGSELAWTDVSFSYRAGAVLRNTATTEELSLWFSARDTTIDFGENSRTGRLTLVFEQPCDSVNPCVPCCLDAGNADNSVSTPQINSVVNIGDVSFLIAYIFLGGESPYCRDQADANGDGSVNIGDVTSLVAYIFTAGAPPACPVK